MAGVAVLAVVAAAAAALMMRGSDSSAKSVAETAPAVHPFLSVFVGGDQVEVPTDIGISYCAGKGKQLRSFVDGKPVGGSPRTVKLVDGERVVVAFGTPSQIRKTRS